jgi:hypothetical protein
MLLQQTLTCTELRNHIYEIILAQTPTHRIWLARRPARDRCRVVSPTLWAGSKRPHMGLTQACQEVRNEFRLLYLNALRYSVAFEELVYFLDTFGPSDLHQNIKSTLMDLKQNPLPAQGVDILPMLNILRLYQERIQVAYGWKRKSSSFGVAAHVVRDFLQEPVDDSNLNQITSVRIRSSLPLLTLPNGPASFGTVIRIDVVPERDTSLNQAKARSIGQWFTREAFYGTIYEIRLETQCGSLESVMEIDRNSWHVPFEFLLE